MSEKPTNIIQIPFSGAGLGHGNGAHLAPKKIQEHLQELFTNEDGYTPSFTQTTIRVDEAHFQKSHTAIQDYFTKHTQKALCLGGDHSITHPILKGLQSASQPALPKDFFLIVFDAHPDLMDDFRPPTQEDYLRVLIEEQIVQPDHVILVGLRNWDKQEISYLKQKNICYYTMKEIFKRGVQDICAEIISQVNKPCYLSLDIDVVDPVEALGTGYTEHGGLSSRELLYFLQEIKTKIDLRMIDIVEVNPFKDLHDMTSRLAAKCVMELSDFHTFVNK